MTAIQASQLTLDDVYRLLKLVEKVEDVSFNDFFSLELVIEPEKSELWRIREDFRPYIRGKKASEGQVKAISLFPLLRLAGFYRYPLQIKIEEGIDSIVIEDEAKVITGRFDLVIVNKSMPTERDVPFWILVIEAKESGVEVRQGLPQLLTYAYTSLEKQPFVWGLATNGLQYLFVYLERGNPPTYQLLPELNFMYSEPAIQLLQVLKAICQLQLV